MDFYHSKEPTVIYPRDIATEAETAALEHADRLAAIIGKHWHPTNDADKVIVGCLESGPAAASRLIWRPLLLLVPGSGWSRLRLQSPVGAGRA